MSSHTTVRFPNSHTQSITSTEAQNLAIVLGHPHVEVLAEKRRAVQESKENELLDSMGKLALELEKHGQYDEAENLHRQTLEGREKVLGPAHPDTLTSVTNLASIIALRGRLSEAKAMNRRAYDTNRTYRGDNHPDTLASMSNLACTLFEQQQYKEAEMLSRKALKGIKEELGENHHSTLTAIVNLASVLNYQGKHKEAKSLNNFVLQVGTGPLIIRVVIGMARGSGDQKCSNKAEDLILSIYKERKASRESQGKREEAKEKYKEALHGFSQQLGPDHPKTVACRNSLVGTQ